MGPDESVWSLEGDILSFTENIRACSLLLPRGHFGEDYHVSGRIFDADLFRSVEGCAQRQHHIRILCGCDERFEFLNFHVQECAPSLDLVRDRGSILPAAGETLVHQLQTIFQQNYESQAVPIWHFHGFLKSKMLGPELYAWF